MRLALRRLTRLGRGVTTDGRDLARRFTKIVRESSGRPAVTDVDESVRVIPRRADDPRPVRRSLFDADSLDEGEE